MDRLSKPKQMERVHCFDAESGEAVWSYKYARKYRDVGYAAGPRTSVVVHDGLAYALGAMGDLHVFNAITGKIAWQRDLNAQYAIRMPVWGIAASPVIYDELLIVQIGGEGACLVAFDRRTGEERWRALDDQASYSTPLIIEQAGRPVLVAWTGEQVVGLDPNSGKAHWQHAFPPQRGIISVASPVIAGNRLLLTNFFDGALMLELMPDQLAATRTWYRFGASEQKNRRPALDHLDPANQRRPHLWLRQLRRVPLPRRGDRRSTMGRPAGSPTRALGHGAFDPTRQQGLDL
jgi:hypothetical protein